MGYGQALHPTFASWHSSCVEHRRGGGRARRSRAHAASLHRHRQAPVSAPAGRALPHTAGGDRRVLGHERHRRSRRSPNGSRDTPSVIREARGRGPSSSVEERGGRLRPLAGAPGGAARSIPHVRLAPKGQASSASPIRRRARIAAGRHVQRATGAADVARTDDPGEPTPAQAPAGVERSVLGVELGPQLARRARDPDQRVHPCQRAHRQQTPLRPKRRHRRGGSRPQTRIADTSWALSPQAVEAIRAQMLLRSKDRDPIFAQRDAAVVSLQYGLGARNQEVWGMRWMSLHASYAEVVEVVSWGALDEWGKTEHSTERRTPSQASRSKISRSGARRFAVGDILLAMWISSFLAISAALAMGSRTPARALATSAATRRRSGDRTTSTRPSRRSPSSLSSATYSARPPTRFDAAASPSGFEQRTHRRWRRSAGRACRCSTRTTHSQSTICAASDHGRSISSGARHERNGKATRQSAHGYALLPNVGATLAEPSLIMMLWP